MPNTVRKKTTDVKTVRKEIILKIHVNGEKTHHLR